MKKLIATCPNSKVHDRFITTAHVVQSWMVDKNGDFTEEISTDEIVSGPQKENTWTCAICGEVANVVCREK